MKWKHTLTHQHLPLCLFAPGRYRPGKDKPDPKTWKANFRCALNSLPDICELREHSRKRGTNAYRVYRMLPSAQTHRRRRGITCAHCVLLPFAWTYFNTLTSWDGAGLSFLLSGLRLFSRPRERQTSLSDDTYSAHTWHPTTAAAAPTSDTLQKVEATVEDTFSSTQTHGERFVVVLDAGDRRHCCAGLKTMIVYCCCAGMWEVKPEDQEQSEAVFKVSELFNFWLTELTYFFMTEHCGLSCSVCHSWWTT